MITRIVLPVLVLLALACSPDTATSPPESEGVKESAWPDDARLYLGKDLLEKRIIEADVK